MGMKQFAKESPEIAAALARFDKLEESIEMTEVCKKYAPLSEDEEELAKTLYELKIP